MNQSKGPKGKQAQFAANDVGRKSSGYLAVNHLEFQKMRETNMPTNNPKSSEFNMKPISPLNLEDYYKEWKGEEHQVQRKGTITQKPLIHKDRKTLILSLILLLSALAGNSTIGIFFLTIDETAPLIRAAWRLLYLVIFMLPFAILDYRRNKHNMYVTLTPNSNCMKMILVASFGQCLWTSCNSTSIQYTSIAHSETIRFAFPIIPVILRALYGKTPSKLEKMAGLAIIVGGTILAFDNDFTTYKYVDLNNVGFFTRLIWGDLMAVFSGVGGVFFFTYYHKLIREMPIYLGTAYMSFASFIMVAIVSLIFGEANLGFNDEMGIFGGLAPKWLFIYILFTVITGFGAFVSAPQAAQQFGSGLVTMIMSINPIISIFLIKVLGWQGFPSALGTIGILLMLPGIMILSHLKGEEEQAENDLIPEIGDRTYSYYISQVDERS